MVTTQKCRNKVSAKIMLLRPTIVGYNIEKKSNESVSGVAKETFSETKVEVSLVFMTNMKMEYYFKVARTTIASHFITPN